MRPSGDTAHGLVFDDFVDKQVVHVSATSFRSGAELVSMAESHIKHDDNIFVGTHSAMTIQRSDFFCPSINQSQRGQWANIMNQWKHFPRYSPFVWEFPKHVFFDLCLTQQWANNGDACDLGCHRARYEVTAMINEGITFAVRLFQNGYRNDKVM